MPPANITRIANIVLRGMTLGSKFVLIFLLAKFLQPAEVGLYGLITATISYVMMAVGFDFYTYATRELINTDQKNWFALIRDQGIFYGLAYAIIFPLSVLIFWFDFLPWSLALWFFPLLFLEHVAQEFNRLLVAMSEPLWASVVLFIRQGLWSVIAAIWMWLVPDQRSLGFVFSAWALGGSLACLIAVSRLHRLDKSSLARSIDWPWIKRGILIAIPFIIATLSLRALYTVDRYWIEALGGVEILAAYVLYMGIAGVIMIFLDAAVFTFLYPALIASATRRDRVAFDGQMKILTRQTILATLGLSLLVLLLAKPMFAWIDRPVYSAHFSILYWTVLASALSGISMIPHYGLYACRLDKAIILSHLASLPIFAVAVYLLNYFLQEAAIPAAMAVTFLFLLCMKFFYFRRYSANFAI